MSSVAHYILYDTTWAVNRASKIRSFDSPGTPAHEFPSNKPIFRHSCSLAPTRMTKKYLESKKFSESPRES
jgi:hypothetical protein